MCSQNNICRLCSKSSSKIVKIFQSDIPFLIEILTCIKVKEDDGLPTFSCEDCISDLHFAHEVRNRIIESDKKLKNSKSTFSNPVAEIHIRTSQDIEDGVLTGDSDYDDAGDGSSNGDDTIDNLINSIKNDYLESSCEDVKETVITKPPLKKFDEIDKQANKNINSDSSDSEEARDEQERLVSSTGSNSNEHIEDTSKDYVIIPEASDIIHVDTSGMKRKYSCLLCNIKLESRNVGMHRNKHIRAKCTLCGLITRSDNIHKHLTTHKSEPRVCDICGTSHKNEESLRVHIYYFHKNRTPYKCKHCSKEFQVNSNLWVHIRRFHTGARSHQCDLCGKAFIDSCTLKRHKEQVHQRLRRFACEDCKKAFSTSYALLTHRRQHTGELPYICDLCSEGFRQLVSLRTHMKSKHNVVMKANKPGYTYTQQNKKEWKKQLEDVTSGKKINRYGPSLKTAIPTVVTGK